MTAAQRGEAAKLVVGVGVREKVADRQSLGARLDQPVDRGGYLCLVQRNRNTAVRRDALADPRDAMSWGEEARRLRANPQVVHLDALLATDYQRVLEARRREDAERRALALQDRVG